MPISARARRRCALATVLLTVAGSVSACGSSHQAASHDPLAAVSSYVAVPGKPLGPAPESVTLATGERWAYRGVPRGTITLLYFGYTSCPDICPLTMADVARALAGVPAAVRSHVRVTFVSTDPRRDTPRQLRSWLGGFDPTFAGARGPIGQVIAAARTYGISIEAPRVTRGDYEVAHGAEVLVLAPGGGMVGYFRAEARWTAYATALPVLVHRYAQGA